MNKEDWDREERNTNYIVAGLMVLLAAVMAFGVLSALVLFVSILTRAH